MRIRRRAQTTFETIPIPEVLERLKQQRASARDGKNGSAEPHRRSPAQKRDGERKQILSLSYDVALLESRQMLLEAHGYRVTSVIGLASALHACQEHRYDLVIIGHSIPAPHKRKMMEHLRAVCATPVLQLQRPGENVPGADYSHNPIEGPQAFLAVVDQILSDS